MEKDWSPFNFITNPMADVVQKFRKLCLEYPESTETDSFGHPNFRAGKKTFAVVEWYRDRPSFGFRVGADNADMYLLQDDGFFATPYGRGQWVSIWVDNKPDWQLVQDLLDQSYRSVALKRMLSALDNQNR